MTYLDGYPGALGFNRFGKLAEPGYIFIIIDMDIANMMFTDGRVDNRVFYNDETRSTPRNFTVSCNHPVIDKSVACGAAA